MEFELHEVNSLHDTVQELLVELTLGSIDWFEDVEATYFSDESDEWQNETGDELTDSEKEEEDPDLSSMPELQDVSDSDSEYGYQSDSNNSNEGSTPHPEEDQHLTPQVSSYLSYFDRSASSMSVGAMALNNMDGELSTLCSSPKEVKEDALEWLFHSPKWDDRSTLFTVHKANAEWRQIDML
ncbi:hypothetical protein GYMLUDRAFT_252742 [Collybiopsis luxurians FD-317 M1]|uniref:Uncharacterized protein n=1 Tax=Collybiopsis luxurians FD-317 M1 TaxID=944289 RepID=A0A0D0B932_9AGAR|nr:hypothetical protein GYMLUDRAFT_252742 [Collybiopsis luxurians FD-317 M1]